MVQRVILAETDFPAPGSVIAAPTGEGRWTVGRVLRRDMEGGAWGVLVLGTRWLSEAIPPLNAPQLREPLVLTHHSWQGQKNLFWTHEPLPVEFAILGSISLSNDDLGETCHRFGGWASLPLQGLIQWRWDHDRESLLREEEQKAAAEMERLRQVAQKRQEFQRTLSLELLRHQTWLESWQGLNQRKSQEILIQLVEDLHGLPKLTKPLVRKPMKQAVEAFNRLDAAQPFLFTQEREDLFEAFEQIACASGFPQLADEIDKWRDW